MAKRIYLSLSFIILATALMRSAVATENIETYSEGATVVASGTCGENLTWTEMSDGKLYIEGTGSFLQDINSSATVIIIGKDVRGVNSNDAGFFRFWTTLTEIIVDEENPYLTAKDGVLFNKDMTELIVYPAGNPRTEYTVPDGVTRIRPRAFERTVYLETITLPEGVTKLDFAAIYTCNVTKLNIPESITHIGSWSLVRSVSIDFMNKLTQVEYIGDNAFYYDEYNSAPDTQSINAWIETQPDGVVYIGNVAYCYKGEMPENTRITLRAGTTQIYSNAFTGYANLTEIEIPDSVVSIGAGALDDTGWYNCQPDGIVYAGKVAYAYKGERGTFTEVEFSADTVGITGNIFENCEATTIKIPEGVRHIDAGVFFCTPSKIILPSTLKHIDRFWDTFSDPEYSGVPLTFGGVKGSFAEQFAFENGIPFEEYATACEDDAHIPGEQKTIAATCTEKGSIIVKCTVCDETLSFFELPILGHSYSAWSITVTPTEATLGEKVRTCSVCNTTESSSISFKEQKADIDGNCEVSIADALLSLQGYLNGSVDNLPDMNNDGRIGLRDILEILKLI